MLERYKWLDKATAKIRFGPDRKAVRRELEAHLEDLREASGLEEEAALEAMGDPAEIAEELGRLHKPWLGYLWRVSQAALALAAIVCCILTAGRLFVAWPELPGMALFEYLTWDGDASGYSDGMLAELECPAGGIVETGGYTIRADRAVMRLYDGSLRKLYIEFHIDSGWLGEELYLGNAISEARDSTGAVYPHLAFAGEVPSYWAAEYDHSPHCFLGQKSLIYLVNVPESAEWVELDIGYGSLLRTLRIDLPKEASA